MRAESLFNALTTPTPPRSLAGFAWPAALRVLVLAPHPDDFDAIAVTLRSLHRCGGRIAVAVLSGSASGVEDGFGGAFTAPEKAALREAEQRESGRALGLPDEQLAFQIGRAHV